MRKRRLKQAMAVLLAFFVAASGWLTDAAVVEAAAAETELSAPDVTASNDTGKKQQLADAYGRTEAEIQEALDQGFHTGEIEAALQQSVASGEEWSDALKEQEASFINRSAQARSQVESELPEGAGWNAVSAQAANPAQPADYSYVNTHPDEAPYSVPLNEETVSTLSGGLTLQHTDLTLPGRNGLSFALTRTYSSGDAQFYGMKGEYGQTRLIKSHVETMYPIGAGWSWDLSSVEFANDKRYLHLAGGGVYEVNDISATLQGYPWLDLSFLRDTTVTAGGEISAYVLISVKGIRQYFNAAGKLIQISDPYANRITFAYSDHPTYGRVLTGITDASGHTISISYGTEAVVLTKGSERVTYEKSTHSGKEVLNRVIDPGGRVTTYDYKLALAAFSLYGIVPDQLNPYALLVGVTHPTGAKSVYEYEDTPITRYIGEKAVNQVYRATSRYSQATYANGTTAVKFRKSVTYNGDIGSSFDKDFTFSTTVDDGLTVTTFQNKKDFFDKETPSVYYTTSMSRTAGGFVQSTDYTYDEAHQYTSPISAISRWLHTATGAASAPVTTAQAYDGYGHVVSSTDALGAVTTYSYDSSMRLLQSASVPIAENQTQYTAYTRNDKGSVTGLSVREGGPAGTLLQQVSYEQMDSYGNPWQTRVKDGARELLIQTEYGAAYEGAFPTKQTVHVTDDSGVSSTIVKQFTYEAGSGRLMTFTDGKQQQTRYEYDVLGRVVKGIHPDGSVVGIAYDDERNEIMLTDETGVQTVTKWDPFGLPYETGRKEWGWYKAKQQTGYDSYGRPMWSEDALGNRTQTEYDAWGRVIRTTYADGAFARTVYDDLARTVTQIDPEGVMLKEFKDELGRTVRQESNGKPLTVYTYDQAGNVRLAVDALSNPTAYTYDALNRLTSVTNAKQETTGYSYNMLGNMTTITYPDQASVSKEYDELGRLRRTVDANGKAKSFFYDANSNVIRSIDRNGATFTYSYDNRNLLRQQSGPDETVQYSYDLAGRRTGMTDRTGTTAYAYSPTTGALTTVTYPDGKRVQYDYDEAGNRRGMSDPFGTTVQYSYDARNRLKTVGTTLEAGEAEATYTYYGNNLLKEMLQNNGVSASFTYDRLRISSLTQRRADGSLLGSYAYSYDDNNNQTGKVEHGASSSYTYDKLNRIETSSLKRESYAYDSRGNRQSMKTNQAVDTSDYTYEYDTKDRLSEVTLKDNRNVGYSYNGDGLLWERTENGETTRYYYDGAQVIAEAAVVSGEAALKARYIRGNGLIAREDEQGKAYYVHNGHGDVVGLMDASGQTQLNAYSYDMWGNSLTTQESVPQPFRYSGELWDNTTSLQYLRARWYDPSMGRFINEDTYEGQIDNPLSLNLYTYVENNPLIYWDPSGHAACNSQSECQAQYQSLNQISASDGMDYMLNQYVFEQVQNNESLINDTKDEKLKDYYRSLNSWYRNNPCSYLAESCTGGTASFTGMEDGFYILSVESGGKTTTYGMNSEYGMTSCNCFTAGTTVLTENGEKPIEEVAIGDKVLAKDEVTGDIAYKEVEWLFQKEVDTLYHLTIDNEVISTTSEHPFWVVGKGWVKTQDLQIGDVLVDSDESEVSIEAIEVENKSAIVYNFMVKDYHTYYVSNLKIWTHNACTLASARKMAVRQAWAQEKALVEQTGKGTVEWSDSQKQELLSNGKVKGYYGHHINSVKGSPELAGVANNIEFVTFKEHLSRHFGNFRNVTVGALLNRKPPNK